MLDAGQLTDHGEFLEMLGGLVAMLPPSVLVPFYLSLIAGRTPAEGRAVARYSALAFAVIGVAFVWAGQVLLDSFSINIDTFRIAGGILLAMTAFALLTEDVAQVSDDEQPFVGASALSLGLVPMTVPMLAGPGAISTIMVFSLDENTPSHKILASAVVLTVALLLFVMLRLALKLGRFFTPSLALAFNRIMGLFVMAIAVEFVLHGLAGHFPDWHMTHA